ncbi:SAF domain-containing protein [Allorhizocola rhizosphaerae]|uniref:SAF domain-containing protein n=1 Tax=Allorhizocola rhizosphaerae TaxID=1872709 RepID=UPI0013C3145B|nr:SAF domain-containing protein [Allorhizocola rhizosphaerae]
MPIVKAAPRRRSVMQGALAVLLIVAGALTAGYVALRIGSTHDFLGVAKPVGKGAEIKADDLMVIRVNDAVGLKPIPLSRANTVVGKRAAVPLVPGTLLTPEQVTDHPVPAQGNQLLGLSLSEDRLPVARVKVGASVLLVVTPKKNSVGGSGENAGDLVPPRTIAGTVVDVKPGTRQGDTIVNVEVSTADAPTVAAMHAEDRIVLTLAG